MPKLLPQSPDPSVSHMHVKLVKNGIQQALDRLNRIKFGQDTAKTLCGSKMHRFGVTTGTQRTVLVHTYWLTWNPQQTLNLVKVKSNQA